MHTMIDLARKEDYGAMKAEVSDSPKVRVSYPSMTITSDKPIKLPDGDFMAEVKLHPTRCEWREDERGKKCWCCTFDVMGIEPGEPIEEEEMEEEVEDAATALLESMKKSRSKKIEESD